MNATKTPYRVVPMDNKYGYQVHAGGKVKGTLRIVATCIAPHGGAGMKTMTPQAKANAEFIVRACNSHDALVKALEDMIEAYESPKMAVDIDALNKARAALIAAGVKP